MVGALGRVLMYLLIVALAIFVFAAGALPGLKSYALIKDAGHRPIAAVQEITIHDLTSQVSVYKGQVVTTTGKVSYSEEHGLYQIADDGNYAVLIRGYSNRDQLEALKDKYVRVTGTFDFEQDLGVYIETNAVIPVESP